VEENEKQNMKLQILLEAFEREGRKRAPRARLLTETAPREKLYIFHLICLDLFIED
jgi:hypothetical protein